MGRREVEIGTAEAGQKLLRFLERKYALPRPLFYKLLRTGQIRVNGSRSKPEQVLAEGDILRLPPVITGGSDSDLAAAALETCIIAQDMLGADLRIVFQDDSLLALDKPFGLATQGGSGISDSVTQRLGAACPAGTFIPAPAHRLDKASSGLLLAGKNYSMQQYLHTLFRSNKAGLERDYLCWVQGDFAAWYQAQNGLPAFEGDWLRLEDCLAQRKGPDGRERVYADKVGEAAVRECAASSAVGLYLPRTVYKHARYGLITQVKARLLTGKKHQIRVQLASRGFPIIGDLRYGGPEAGRMMLHALHIKIPRGRFGDFLFNEYELECAPEASFLGNSW